MAKLNEDEAKLLRRLQRKAEAPDAPPASRALNISIDLGDEAQVERAQKLGLLDMLTGSNDDEPPDDDNDDDDDDEDVPQRRGYFNG